MFIDLHRRAQKVGQPPGSAVYTGDKQSSAPSHITLINYTESALQEVQITDLSKDLSALPRSGTTWLNVEGLQDTKTIETIAAHYHLHPLTIEDLLNVEQRPKIEEFDHYLFITLKQIHWETATHQITLDQLSLILGKNFVLSFHEAPMPELPILIERLRHGESQALRQKGPDYLLYRIIDIVVDHYFVVLEELCNNIEDIEETVVLNPDAHHAHAIYRIKRHIIALRKAIWPMRETISHLLQLDQRWVLPFTHVYLRDVYDHTMQALDTLETFRDMLESLLDVYLSSINNRMNEIMKVLTIIATFFIPMTFVASIYGMNFDHMPELHWRYGYPLVLSGMFGIGVIMLRYFRKKKWI